MTLSTRQKPVEHVPATVLCVLLIGAEVAFLVSGIIGSAPVFGEEQVFVQGARSHHQRAGELAGPDNSKISLKQFGAELSRVPEVVRHQLILSHNEGLVVNSVQKDSVAERIGLKPHDILVQFDEQYLLLPEQFSLLLESCLHQRHGENHKVPKVIFIRSGERRAISLVHNDQKELPETQRYKSGGWDRHSHSQRINKTSELQSIQSSTSVDSLTDIPSWNGASEPVVLLREDADCTIRLTQGKETRLQVHSPDRKYVFDELLSSQASLQAVPESIRGRVDMMLQVLEAHAGSIDKKMRGPGSTGAQTARLPTVNSIEKQPTVRR